MPRKIERVPNNLRMALRMAVGDQAGLLRNEDGQGLVEYVLILAVIAFAAVAGMNGLASSINSAMTKVATYLGNYIS